MSHSTCSICINRNKDGLFRLVRKKQWDQATTRVGLFPEEASAHDMFTFSNGDSISTLPLHLACMYKAPLKLVLALIAADPSTCTEQDGIGRTPLYNAVRYGCSYDVVSVLIATNPNMVNLMADDGSLPIHVACSKATSISVIVPTIKHLLWMFPDSILMTDFSGQTPRDYTIKNPSQDVREEILRELVRYEARFIAESYDPERGNDASSSVGTGLVSPSEGETTTSLNRSSSPTFDFSDSPGFQLMNDVNDIMRGRSHETKTKQCVICMARPVSRVLVPCGHPCLCDQCARADTLDKLQWKCPECRTKSTQIVRFFGRVAFDE